MKKNVQIIFYKKTNSFWLPIKSLTKNADFRVSMIFHHK